MQHQLDSTRKNRPVFQRLQQDLAAFGFIRTWQQCRMKIKNITPPTEIGGVVETEPIFLSTP